MDSFENGLGKRRFIMLFNVYVTDPPETQQKAQDVKNRGNKDSVKQSR